MKVKNIDISGYIIPNDWTSWITNDPSYHTASSLMAEFRAAYSVADMVHVNIGVLYGGSVWEGKAVIAFMADMVNKGKMKVHVTGLAASMGAVMALRTRASADPYAEIMWHGVSGGVYGTVTDIEEGLNQIKRENALMVQMLMDVAELPKDEAEALLVGDNFLTAEEALAKNLIGGITDAPFGDANLTNKLSATDMELINSIKTKGFQAVTAELFAKIMGPNNGPIVNKMTDNEKQALVADAVSGATAPLINEVANLKTEIEGLKATHAQELEQKATTLTADFEAKIADLNATINAKNALIAELEKRPATAQASGEKGDELQGGAKDEVTEEIQAVRNYGARLLGKKLNK